METGVLKVGASGNGSLGHKAYAASLPLSQPPARCQRGFLPSSAWGVGVGVGAGECICTFPEKLCLRDQRAGWSH